MWRFQLDKNVRLREWFTVQHFPQTKAVWFGPLRFYYGKDGTK